MARSKYGRTLFALFAAILGRGLAHALTPATPLLTPNAAASDRGRCVDCAIDRLNHMPVDQRRRTLSQLPAERRRNLEDHLQWYNELPQAERQRLLERYSEFQKLPIARQAELRTAYRRFASLPEVRQSSIRSEVERLQALPETGRRRRMRSPDLRRAFSSAELQLLDALSKP